MRLPNLLMLLTSPGRRALQRLRQANPSLSIAGSASLQQDGPLHVGRDVVVSDHAKLLVPSTAQLVLDDGAYVGRDVELGPGGVIRLGQRVSLQDRCVIVGDVDIGSFSLLSLNVLISSGRHYHRHQPHDLIRNQDRDVLSTAEGRAAHSQPVRIGEDCWLGVNTVVMPGVRIGRGAVVGANSVVTRDVEPYSVVAGAPANPIGKRMDFCPPAHIAWDNPLHTPYFHAGFDLASDQREAQHTHGGLVAHRSFEVWLEHRTSMLRLRVRGVGPVPSTLSQGALRWNITPSDWTEIEVPSQPGPTRFELSGPGVAVAEATSL